MRALCPIVFVGAAAMALQGGCTTTRATENDSIEPIAFGEIVDRGPAVGADDVLPLNEVGAGWARTFDDEAPGAAEPSVTYALGTREGGLWVSEQRGERTVRERLLIAREDGSVVVPRMHNTSRRLITIFDPPILFLPGPLEPGQRIEQEVELTVRPASEPDRIEREGTGTLTIESVGQQEVTIDGQTERISLIRTTFESDFGVARVQRQTEWWIGRRDGLIAVREDEEVRVLGFVSERNRSLLVWEGARQEP
ncbi:MAG: hypothetical protein AAGI30_11265 [Planctomycetota bacterium]